MINKALILYFMFRKRIAIHVFQGLLKLLPSIENIDQLCGWPGPLGRPRRAVHSRITLGSYIQIAISATRPYAPLTCWAGKFQVLGSERH